MENSQLKFYVYIIKSLKYPDNRYVGYTSNHEQRLINQNTGKTKSTISARPWQYETLIGFTSEKKAKAFELYLKTGSGY